MGSISPPSVNIIDIRRDKSSQSLRHVIQQSVNPEDGSLPSLPTLLLYDEKGLKLFQDITYVEEYYLTNAEIEALTTHADRIASQLPRDVRLIELGSGNLRKVKILLDAFERLEKDVEYFALDLSYTELERTFAELDISSYQFVSFSALHGTYNDGLAWLARPENQARTNCVMSMGSSIGNFSRSGAADFLQSFKQVLQPADYLIVGLDACQDRDRVLAAYNDCQGLTNLFYRNGLNHASELLGKHALHQDAWTIETLYNETDHVHTAFYSARSETAVDGKTFHKGDKIHIEDAYKYSATQRDKLWHDAGLILQSSYGNSSDDYHLHLLSPSTVHFPTQPDQYATTPTPSLKDWQQLWCAWDTVTKAMVPRDELMNKPIKLRNNLIFYLGHIPTFADIHYTRATKSKPIDPAYYSSIFERGIDPDVDDPERCHDHSVIPDEWPPLEEILGYSDRVRARITASIESGVAVIDKKLSRAFWLAFEHEAMHLETFLYMLLQSERVLPAPGLLIPNFEKLAIEAASKREPNRWHRVPEQTLKVGIDDPENDLPPTRYFGWDNERPKRAVSVQEFEAQSRPISNGDYAFFLEQTQQTTLPASWVQHTDTTAQVDANGIDLKTSDSQPSASFLLNKAVRTVYGPIELKYTLDWPVMASYDELAAFAKWAGGHIPSFEETRSIYHYVEQQKKEGAEQVSSTLISAVNGHLCNNGVEETPPHNHSSHDVGAGVNVNTDQADTNTTTQNINPKDTFIDLHGCNTGFQAWQPTPITNDSARLRGQSDCGGLWEWTSSPLTPHAGFKPMDLYPGYTSDFFDDKHNICLGGSWATVPRIAGRKSFVNWYQRNYPYTWATARLARHV